MCTTHTHVWAKTKSMRQKVWLPNDNVHRNPIGLTWSSSKPSWAFSCFWIKKIAYLNVWVAPWEIINWTPPYGSPLNWGYFCSKWDQNMHLIFIWFTHLETCPCVILVFSQPFCRLLVTMFHDHPLAKQQNAGFWRLWDGSLFKPSVSPAIFTNSQWEKGNCWQWALSLTQRSNSLLTLLWHHKWRISMTACFSTQSFWQLLSEQKI